MHKDFPKLFAEISTAGSQREQRWAGVAAFTRTATRAKIEVLARLAFATKSPAAGLQQEDLAAALAEFRSALSDADPSIEHGARQDQVLAAAALLQYCASDPFAAMAVTTTACGGARSANIPIDMVAAASSALAQLAAAGRNRPVMRNIEIEAPTLEYDLKFDEVQPGSPTTFKTLFDQIADSVDEAIAALTTKFNEATKALVEAGKKADEELDMLSWVFGEHTLVPRQAFANVPASQRPLVYGRDLASLTTIYPGPNSLPALFTRAGMKLTGKLKIVEAVNAVSDTWTEQALEGLVPSPATSPIHFALARRQETGAGDGWQAGWAAITGIDAAATLPPVTLAEQFYREILWLR